MDRALDRTRHTPGPWVAVQYKRSQAWRVTLTPYDAHGDIANVVAGLAALKDYEVAANARLIAAAPDLLEACELALLARNQFEGDAEGALFEMEHRLRGAIKKAKCE